MKMKSLTTGMVLASIALLTMNPTDVKAMDSPPLKAPLKYGSTVVGIPSYKDIFNVIRTEAVKLRGEGYDENNIHQWKPIMAQITLEGIKYDIYFSPASMAFQLETMTDDEILKLLNHEEKITIDYSNLSPNLKEITKKRYIQGFKYPSINLGGKSGYLSVHFSDEKEKATCQDHNGPKLEEIEHEYYKDLGMAKAEYNSPEEVQLECNNVPSLKDIAISKLKQMKEDSSAYPQMEDHFDEHEKRTGEK